MPCTTVNSQSQLQARLPTLPATLPSSQGQWTAFLNTLRLWGQQLQQEQHAPNVIPSQFQTYSAASATPVIAALTAATCTPSIDNTNQYYGAASLKVSGITSGATLQFTGTPISIAPATRWFCSFQILAPSGCTGSLTVKTSGGHTITESFSVSASASWQQVWGLFDLRQYADAQATWEFTITSTATINLDGLQMNAVGDILSGLPRFAGTQMVLATGAYAANLDGIPDGITYERMPGSNMDGNRRGLIDFSQGGHISKNLDNISDGSTYGRPLASRLSSGKPWIDFSESIHANKILDNIADGTTYARYKSAGLTSGLADPSLGGIQAKGSIPPIVIGASISWTTTSGALALSWSAFTIYRPDGTTTSISTGSQNITGLTNGTTYTIYPYIVDGQTTVSFATGQTGGVGTPAICYAGGSGPAAAACYANANIPLQSFLAAPSAGGGGGGGNATGCLHPDTYVNLADGSTIRAADVEVGHALFGPAGPARITHVSHKECGDWVRVRFTHGTHATVTTDHRFLRPDGEQVRAADLHVGGIIAGHGRNVEVEALELIREKAAMVMVNVEYPHLYYLAGALSHNGNPKP